MTEFQTQTDIGNRALQHIGQRKLDPVQGFNENSKAAREVSFAYPKLRRAELRRNVWRFATRRAPLRPIDTNTMLLAPSLWSASATYFVGSIVSDSAGNAWISRIPNNVGNLPNATPPATTWEPYFGPLTVSLWSSTQTYFSGDLVYTAAGDGTNRVYLSLISGNADTPSTATAWSATSTYMQNQVVTFASVAYMSLIDLNINNEPDLAPALFNIATTYSAGAKVGASNGVIYQSVGSGNVGHDPTTDGGVHWTNTGVLNPWTTVFTSGAGSLNWRQIGGAEFPNGVTLAELNIIYPIGSGPLSQSFTNNVYRLPCGFLREAPQDPKAGSYSWLGSPSNTLYNDWVYEGNYFVTQESDPIIFRFVADVTDVSQMDDMFCEGLAARTGMEVCETLTQSTAKLAELLRIYEKLMDDARDVNGIETGSTELPLDDLIACRL